MKKTKFKDLFIVQNIQHSDIRGNFRELIRENKINKKFPFLVTSYSKKNVIRGLHLQRKKSQGKYISVIKGKIFDVALDLRKNSKTFGLFHKCILSSKNSKSLFVPPGFAHGFQALEDENFVVYSCTQYRDSLSETSIKYNDKNLKIPWPSKDPIISEKDKNGLSLKEYRNIFCK